MVPTVGESFGAEPLEMVWQKRLVRVAGGGCSSWLSKDRPCDLSYGDLHALLSGSLPGASAAGQKRALITIANRQYLWGVFSSHASTGINTHSLHQRIHPPAMFSSVQFSRSVMSNSLRPHGLQHAWLACPSPAPGVCSNSCPLSR